MTDAERNDLLFQGYLLGQRVLLGAQAIGIFADEHHTTWDLLREVADGRTVLVKSPAEKEPWMEQWLKEILAHGTDGLAQHDRDLARRVLAGFAATLDRR